MDETLRGWRGAGLGLVAIVFIFGSFIVLGIGGWYTWDVFCLLLGLCAAVILRLTRTGHHRR